MAKVTTAAESAVRCSWVRGECVGRGSFGTVNVAVDKSGRRLFAVKSVDLSACDPRQVESLENEIRVLRRLPPHPHVVGFLGDDVSREGTAPYRNLRLEFMPGGTLADVAGGADESAIRRYTYCLVSALRHLHSHGFVHCDVKGRNVLLGTPDSCSAKLADFGSSMEIESGGSDKRGAPIVPRGSPLWMAPEVIRCEYQGPESDVWSMGCTVIEMATGKPAWEEGGFDALSRIGYSVELPRFPTTLSELGHDFLEKCLRRDPKERWSCVQLLQHPFLLRQNSIRDSSSPRCVLDWIGSDFEELEPERGSIPESLSTPQSQIFSAKDRIWKLVTTAGAPWDSDGWIEIRGATEEEEGASGDGTGSIRVDTAGPEHDMGDDGGRDSTEWQRHDSCSKVAAAEVDGWRFGNGRQDMGVAAVEAVEAAADSHRHSLLHCMGSEYSYLFSLLLLTIMYFTHFCDNSKLFFQPLDIRKPLPPAFTEWVAAIREPLCCRTAIRGFKINLMNKY